MTTAPALPCPVCGGDDIRVVFRTAAPVPVFCNWLYASAEAALDAAAAEIRLVVCAGCGHLYNEAHDEALVTYGAGYENSLHFSPSFSRYADGLAARLVSQHGLGGGTVLEIGSGKGDFLTLLVEHGAGQAVGYDPSYDGEQDADIGDARITFVRGLFPERPGGLDVDLVCARHVLEHVQHPAAMLSTLRDALRASRPAVLYVEVPDGGYLLGETALWDLIYEHPSHFTASSLHRLSTDAGLPVTSLSTSFGDQYLCLEATSDVDRRGVSAPSVGPVLDLAAGFADRASYAIHYWQDELAQAAAAGRRVALWGTGSKGVTFLNVVPGALAVEHVVDVNPRKHGKHVPGTGHQVVGPPALPSNPPDLVIVMNPLYVDEVRSEMSRLGIRAEVMSAVTSPAAASA